MFLEKIQISSNDNLLININLLGNIYVFQAEKDFLRLDKDNIVAAIIKRYFSLVSFKNEHMLLCFASGDSDVLKKRYIHFTYNNDGWFCSCMYDYEFGIVHESLLDICAFISKAYASYADKEFEL